MTVNDERRRKSKKGPWNRLWTNQALREEDWEMCYKLREKILTQDPPNTKQNVRYDDGETL
jgi:hypothetical protein